MTSIAFHVEPFEENADVHLVTPVVGGVSFAEWVEEYERDRELEPSGGYGGLIPEYFQFGSASTHFLAAEGAFVDEEGRVPLLGCSCGEWGCWPLLSKIMCDEGHVRWSSFRQPHRPNRDYGGFGPFVFARSDYLAALETLSLTWSSRNPVQGYR